jgi:2-polyprenyl-3-methyl-5-hydroxy-6-metoxy-1,4-benzoquinol methylase
MGRHPHADGWNRNVHYHRIVLDAVPMGAGTALDVGCGEGLLARDLRRVIPRVTGLDSHAPTVELARSHPCDGVEFLVGDLLGHHLQLGSFDLVASIAALHHMDTAAGLSAMRDLVRPGGTLVVVGIARSRYPRDAGWDAAGAVVTRAHMVTKTFREVSAPIVWPPPLTFAETRAVAEVELPGVRYRRLVQGRYSLVWVRPGRATSDGRGAR